MSHPTASTTDASDGSDASHETFLMGTATPNDSAQEADETAPYVYHPLAAGQIRILELFPGEFSKPLRGALVPMDLDEFPLPSTNRPLSAPDGEDENFQGRQQDANEQVLQPQSSLLKRGIRKLFGKGRERQTREFGSCEGSAEHPRSKLPSSVALNPSPNQVQVKDRDKSSKIQPQEEDVGVELREETSSGVREKGEYTIKDTAFPYEAISYTWGPPVFDHRISIERCGHLDITASLYSALQRFRLRDRIRRLWADAICIDQGSKYDKQDQVARMMTIYQKASKVLVWLGPAEPDDQLAFAAMDKLIELANGGIPGTIRMEGEMMPDHWLPELQSTLQSMPQFQHIADPASLSSKALLQALRIATRSWFSRMWVVQEVACRRDRRDVSLTCGPYTISWLDLQYVQLGIQANYNRFPFDWKERQITPDTLSSIVGAVELPQLTERLHRTNGLAGQLARLSSRQCTLANDRVYALLGLLCLQELKGVEPNYSRPPMETFRNLMVGLFEHFDWRQFYDTPYSALALVGTETSKSQRGSRSSWVPDFHCLTARSRTKIQAWGSHNHSQFTRINCVIKQSPEIRPVPGRDALLLEGRVFATVNETLAGSSWSNWLPHQAKDLKGELRRFREWYDHCFMFVQRITHNTFPADDMSLMACLTQGSITKRVDILEDRRLQSAANAEWMRSQIGDEEWKRMKLHCLPSSVWNILMPWLEEVIWGKTLWSKTSDVDVERILCSVTTDSGVVDVAWVPPTARQGDQLCVFSYAEYPFVLRRQHHDQDPKYTILGDAWTLDIVLKEALGGKHTCRNPKVCRRDTDKDYGPVPRSDGFCNIWYDGDEDMKALMDRIGHITLV